MVKEKYVTEVRGKKFITFNGLLDEAHKAGIEETTVTELKVDWDKKCAYCIVACKMGDKEFTGVGSATPENCGSMVREHFVEMAHTRAKARCYRDCLNIDMVALDELTDTKSDKKETPKANTDLQDSVPVPNVCCDCGTDITDAVKDFSVKNFKRTLCFNCQKKQKEKDEKGVVENGTK